LSELQSRKEGSPPACPVWVDSSIRSESDLIRPNRMHLAGKSAHNYARIFVTDQDGQSYTQLPLPSPLGSSSCRRNPVKPAPLFVVKLVNVTKAATRAKIVPSIFQSGNYHLAYRRLSRSGTSSNAKNKWRLLLAVRPER